MFEKTGAQALVFCDRKVVLASEDRYGISEEEVETVGKETGKACYALSSPPLIEESATWSDLGGGDYYPTMEVYLGSDGWSDDEILQEGVRIRSDFDTGSREAVFDENTCKAVSDQVGLRLTSDHLGRKYTYRLRQMKVEVTNGKTCRCVTRYVKGVENWDDVSKNPFRIVNADREGLVGRLLMSNLLLKITLDPSIHTSQWELL